MVQKQLAPTDCMVINISIRTMKGTETQTKKLTKKTTKDGSPTKDGMGTWNQTPRLRRKWIWPTSKFTTSDTPMIPPAPSTVINTPGKCRPPARNTIASSPLGPAIATLKDQNSAKSRPRTSGAEAIGSQLISTVTSGDILMLAPASAEVEQLSLLRWIFCKLSLSSDR